MATKGNILIIDDEQAILDTLKTILEKSGYSVFTSDKLDASKNIIKKNPVDIVFADISLQGESGLDIISFVREQNLQIPVVMITGVPDIDTASEAIRLGAFDYITKPISIDTLVSAAERAIEKKRLGEEWKQVEKLKSEYTRRLEREVALQIVQIKENERKYKTLVEQSLVGVFIVHKGILKYVNSKFCSIFEYELKELLDEFPVSNLVHPDEQMRLKDIPRWQRILREKSYIHEESSALTKFGRKIAIEFWISRIIYEEKLAIQGIVIDITEKEQLREQEKALQLELIKEHKLATIGELAAGIAHNLNNPLSTLMGYIELMKMKYPEIPELNKLLSQTKKMNGIINTLVRKSEKDHLRSAIELDLNQLIREELNFLEADLHYKHQIECEVDLADDLPPINAVYSDFSQSFHNIVRNALDAMFKSDEKKLAIKTSVNKNEIVLSVQDTGCGIDEKNLSNIFTPFFTTKPVRGEQAGDEPYGTGLGLSSVYKLLAPYGVKFDVNSELGKGTSFVIRIPVTP